MSPSSGRGQVDPIAALVAVLAIGAGVVVYANVTDSAMERTPERSLAPATLERVHEHLAPASVVSPGRLETVDAVLPDGYETNVSLTSADVHRTVGPPLPGTEATSAARVVSVRHGPADVRVGRLRVAVWR